MSAKPPTTIIRRTTSDTTARDHFNRSAAAVGQRLIDDAANGTLTGRQARRIRRTTRELTGVISDLGSVAERGHDLVRSAAELTRDLEKIATEIDEFQTKRARNEAERAAAKVTAAKGATVLDAQLDVQLLTAQLQRAELREKLDARKAAATEAKKQVKTVRETAPPHIDAKQAAKDARAEAARRKNDDAAAQIVRDVQIGAVPSDAAHPYHAYAACVYLTAKLEDDRSSAEAAGLTRDAVLAMMLGTEVAAAQVEVYHAAYLELKDRAAAAAKRREATELFAAVDTFAGGVQ
ncbi:MAG TPA: hypothetical protein VEK11_00890 [Thermoanaerobaculia bacterium]|nr:hypothetical protein [Thermoanaerobaculia bacterium]